MIGITKRDCGVTGHGLRHEFAENAAILAGMIPATRGGIKGQLRKEVEDLNRMQLSETLGHSRTSITGAYLGKLGPKIQNNRGEHIGLIILGENRAVTIFMNPPPIKKPNGEFVKLTKHDAQKVDILVVLSGDKEGLQSELASFSFQEPDEKFIASFENDLTPGNKINAINEAELTRRLGRKLLLKVGVII